MDITLHLTRKMDKQLYSRQLYAIGHEAMNKLIRSSMLIVGMSGIGTEIAKNAVLCGAKEIDLYDGGKTVEETDLEANYYCKENDIGKCRLETIYSNLVELNPYVKINMVNEIPNVSKYSVVIATQLSPEERITISEECRQNNVKLILVNSYGLWGSIFCDFGEHLVLDMNGEEIKKGVITQIENCIATTLEDHKFVHQDMIQIGENVYDIIAITPNTFQITHINGNKVDKIIKMSDNIYLTTFENIAGVKSSVPINEKNFTQVKQKTTVKFQSYIESIQSQSPKLSGDIFANPSHITDLHNFNIGNRKNPIIVSGEIAPMNSILGGIAVQEAMKAVTNKFMPIDQWFYYSELENISLDTLDRVKSATGFIVGSGAIGCELLKNLAMMGIHKVKITDMDTIEKSNLNRQFLFRNSDIGQYKSSIACEAIKKMRPNLEITALTNRVGNETEYIFNENFFSDVDCVFNALDNIPARLFVDNLCIKHKKPLFESGTMGTKGSTQVILPYLTETYGSTTDPEEKQIPMCTVKSFPYAIEHTIQYAREQFEYYFRIIQSDYRNIMTQKSRIAYISDGELYELYKNLKYYQDNYPSNYYDSVRWAFNLWHELFRNQILQILHQFKPDHVVDGNLFWSGTKKCPTYKPFDVNNAEHLDFIKYASTLWNRAAGHQDVQFEDYIDYISTLKPDTFIPTDEKVSVTDEEEKKRNETKQVAITADAARLYLTRLSEFPTTVNPEEFEKDNDSNNHINFITSLSNNRAIVYGITPENKYVTKGIAGRIIPALATTTATVAGLVCMEFYKLFGDHQSTLDKYKSTTLNLADGFMCCTMPQSAKVNSIGNFKFTLWDSLTYPKSIYLADLICDLEGMYNIIIDSLNYGNFLIYSEVFFDEEELYRRKGMKIIDIIESFTGNVNGKISIDFSILDDGMFDEDYEIPSLPSIVLL